MNTALLKGEQPGPGRPKGTPNRTTQQIKDTIQNIVSGNLSQIETDLRDMRPKDRVRAILDLMGFILPRMSSADARVSLTTLSDKELDGILDRIISDKPSIPEKRQYEGTNY